MRLSGDEASCAHALLADIDTPVNQVYMKMIGRFELVLTPGTVIQNKFKNQLRQ
jgi:hypothetical protein